MRMEVPEQITISLKTGRIELPLLTTMDGDIFLLFGPRTTEASSIWVYDRINMAKVKDVIPLPEMRPIRFLGHTASQSLFILDMRRGFGVSVMRITKDAKHHFSASPILCDIYAPQPMLSIGAHGGLILSWVDTVKNA